MHVACTWFVVTGKVRNLLPEATRAMAEDDTDTIHKASSPSLIHVKESTFPRSENPKLRYIKPYWWPYKTFVKDRSVPTTSLLYPPHGIN